MKGETIAAKLNPQTCNLMSSGGGGFEALTVGDIQGLMMSVDATPLIWSYFEAKYMIQPKAHFQQKIVFWLHNRLLNQKRLSPAYIAKNHINAVNASHQLSEGMAGYLARHKIKNEALSPWFDIEKHTFNRKYAPFIRDCIADLEQQLRNLEWQIHEKTQKD